MDKFEYLDPKRSTDKSELDDTINHINLLLEKTNSENEKTKLYISRANIYHALNDDKSAINDCLLGLKCLDVNVPKMPSRLKLTLKYMSIYFKLWWYSKKHSLDNLHITLSECSDDKTIMIVQLYSMLSLFTIGNCERLENLACYENILLSLKHGVTEFTYIAFIKLALLASQANRSLAANGLLQIAYQLNTRSGIYPIDVTMQTLEAVLIKHWHDHHSTVVNQLQAAVKKALTIENVAATNFAYDAYISAAFFIENSLAAIQLSSIADVRDNSFKIYAFIINKLLSQKRNIRIHYLLKKIDSFEKHKIETPTSELSRNIRNIMFAFIFYMANDYKTAITYLTNFKLNYDLCNSLYDIEYQTVLALALFAQDKKNLSLMEKLHIRRVTNKIVANAYKWKKRNRFYSHLYYLLEAEKFRFQANNFKAIKYYEYAIQDAKDNNSTCYLGIANERAGDFYHSLKLENLAGYYLQEAYLNYKHWGAIAKCNQLEKIYPNLITVSDEMLGDTLSTETKDSLTKTDMQEQGLDQMAIIKAMNAISNEAEIEKLLEMLLKLVKQVAGADRVVLIAHYGSQWVIQAEVVPENTSIVVFPQEPLTQEAKLPVSLLQYVFRTRETLLIDDASQILPEYNIHDTYITNNNLKSLLIIPIAYLGKINYVLYLENNTSTHAFTKQHNHNLQLLVTQAALSLQNAHLFYQSTHDALTGLANRNLLYKTFDSLLYNMNKDKDKIAIVFIDVDHFKDINDTYGHEIGDKILIFIANTLKSILRPNDLAVRLGGDEFLLMVNCSADAVTEIKTLMQQYYQILKKPFTFNGSSLQICSSSGVSIYPENANSLPELLKYADIALYISKQDGGNQLNVYSPDLKNIQNEILGDKSASDNQVLVDQLIIFYQPIYDAKTLEIIGLEAFLRWNHPKLGILLPSEFLELLHKNNPVFKIDTWILETVCMQIADWKARNIPIVPISINLSHYQTKIKLHQKLISILHKFNLSPNLLQIIVPETTLLSHLDSAINELTKIKQDNIKIIISDFGTNFSNISYLNHLQPQSFVKIDKVFISGIKRLSYFQIIISAIIKLAHNLDLKVIADGVETEKQFDYLSRHGVDAVQGDYMQTPVDADNCVHLLTHSKIPKS